MKLPVFKTVGTTLAFGLRHFPAFYLLCLLSTMPTDFYELTLLDHVQTREWQGGLNWDKRLLNAVETLLAGFVAAVMVHTRLRDQQGESRTVFAGYRDSLQHLPTVLGVSLIYAIGMAVFSVAIAVFDALAPLAVILPFLVFGILALIFAVVVPCAAVDSEGVFACFEQSAQLTAGSRLRILAVYLLILAPVMGAGVVLAFAFVPDLGRSGIPKIWLFLGGPLMGIFASAVPVVVHESLIELKGHMPFGKTAAVFD